MSRRAYVLEAEPHRDLIRLEHDVQRGEDIRTLEAAAVRRLEARGISAAPLGRDGILGPSEFDRLVTAGRYLGALESTLAKRDAKGRPVLTVGVQQMIRYPGRRTDAQLARAEDRLEELLRSRSERPSPGRLNADQVGEARTRAIAAMRLALDHAPAVHYTQGSRRWDGIRLGLRSASGKFPTYADCSSLTTWALWNALTGVGGMEFPDVVNGADWQAGYTGTQRAHGIRVQFDALRVGDLIHYDGHVAMYRGNGRVISHGSEGGPYDLPMRYRGDVLEARRYIY